MSLQMLHYCLVLTLQIYMLRFPFAVSKSWSRSSTCANHQYTSLTWASKPITSVQTPKHQLKKQAEPCRVRPLFCVQMKRKFRGSMDILIKQYVLCIFSWVFSYFLSTQFLILSNLFGLLNLFFYIFFSNFNFKSFSFPVPCYQSKFLQDQKFKWQDHVSCLIPLHQTGKSLYPPKLLFLSALTLL